MTLMLPAQTGSDDSAELRRLRRRLKRCRRELREGAARLREERAVRERLERALAAKDLSLATACHELRTPLSAILGWAELARSGGLSADTLASAWAKVEQNARLQTMLIADLADASRGAGDALRVERRPVDFADPVAAAVDVVAPTAAAKGVELSWQRPATAARVWGDALRLQQVAWNLLTNAVKFTPSGGVVRVEIGACAEAVALRVSDTGRGISAAFLPRVFQRYERDPLAGEAAAGSSGLGLAIVRRIVEMHGGSVSAHSAGPGKGATFVVSLPHLRSDEPVAAHARA